MEAAQAGMLLARYPLRFHSVIAMLSRGMQLVTLNKFSQAFSSYLLPMQHECQKASCSVELQLHTDRMCTTFFVECVLVQRQDQVFAANLERHPYSSYVQSLYGSCKLWSASCRGSFWGSLRAGVQPMFHSTHLNTYAETINQAVDDLAVNLDKIAEAGEEVDIFRQLGRMTMQVIGAAAFG